MAVLLSAGNLLSAQKFRQENTLGANPGDVTEI